MNYYKAIISVLFVLLACDKIPDKIVDLPDDNYAVVKVIAPSELALASSKSPLTFSIEVNNPHAVKNIFANIISQNSGETIFSNVAVLDNGDISNNADQKKDDGIFSAKVDFDTTISSGKYSIEIFINSINSTQKKVAVSSFTFDNGKNNLPPIISNLVMPDTIAREQSFIFTLKVSDPNGLKQIKSVYFQLVRPDGSLVVDNNNNPNISMQDNGNEEIFGDVFAGDGIFSFKNYFAATAQTGKWVFKFKAIDFANAESNEIIHELVVQ
ncbi:MAG: hypothetical protein Fur0015_13590 [Ignavibacteriales bacterium]